MIIKAELERSDDGTDVETVGWAGWSLRALGDAEVEVSVQPPLLSLAMALDEQPSPGSLGAFILTDERRWLFEWMARKRFLTLSLLATKPVHQGKGVGTTLLRWGCEWADKKALPCYLSATPAGVGIYRSAGWKEVGRLELELAEWAADGGRRRRLKGTAAEMGWGRYVLRYMIRLPDTFKPLHRILHPQGLEHVISFF